MIKTDNELELEYEFKEIYTAAIFLSVETDLDIRAKFEEKIHLWLSNNCQSLYEIGDTGDHNYEVELEDIDREPYCFETCIHEFHFESKDDFTKFQLAWG